MYLCIYIFADFWVVSLALALKFVVKYWRPRMCLARLYGTGPVIWPHSANELPTKRCLNMPIGSMYGIFTYIWVIYGENVGKYSIHGAYGVYNGWCDGMLHRFLSCVCQSGLYQQLGGIKTTKLRQFSWENCDKEFLTFFFQTNPQHSTAGFQQWNGEHPKVSKYPLVISHIAIENDHL